MFTKIVVHFPSNGRELHATLTKSTNAPPSGVLFFANNGERDAFADRHHLEVRNERTLPASVKLTDTEGEPFELSEDAQGPEVCYLDGSVMVCW